jgi:hypothetical protein
MRFANQSRAAIFAVSTLLLASCDVKNLLFSDVHHADSQPEAGAVNLAVTLVAP